MLQFGTGEDLTVSTAWGYNHFYVNRTDARIKRTLCPDIWTKLKETVNEHMHSTPLLKKNKKKPTSRYGQFHVARVTVQTLDDHIEKTRFVEHSQRLVAAFTVRMRGVIPEMNTQRDTLCVIVGSITMI